MVARRFQPWGQKKKTVDDIFGAKRAGPDRGFIKPETKNRPAIKPADFPDRATGKVKPATLGPNAPGTFRPATAPQPTARRPGSGPIVKTKDAAARRPGSGPIISSNNRNQDEEFDRDAIMRRFNKRFGTKLKGRGKF